MEPDLLVDIYAIERSLLRVVMHHLIADGIGGVVYALLEQGYPGDKIAYTNYSLRWPLPYARPLVQSRILLQRQAIVALYYLTAFSIVEILIL